MKSIFLRTDFFGHLNTGGSFSHIGGFLDGMIELGHEMTFTASAQCYPSGKYDFRHIPYPFLYKNFPEIPCLAYNNTLQKKLPPLLREIQPDFLYQRHSEFVYSPSNIAKKHSIPFILEANNSEWWWKKNWANLFFDDILRRCEDVHFHAADAIMVVSEVLKQDLVRLFNLPPEKIHVNPNGVDVHTFTDNIDSNAFFASLSAELQQRWEGKTLCGFVGTFGEWHGVEVLAHSVVHAVRENPNIHFMLIGDGKLRGNVEKIIAENNMQNHVTLLGTVTHHLVPSYLSLCQILLSPHTENTDGTLFFGSPTKLFEYMGMGKAIIASAVGQIADIIKDGHNGVLVKQRNPVDLAHAIIRLTQEPELCHILGKNARYDAVTTYSWKHNAQRVINVVQSL